MVIRDMWAVLRLQDQVPRLFNKILEKYLVDISGNSLDIL
ncbi:hypothetical protein FACS1894122_06600 [Alphaproteobacteria bacterium]|nr:hypothetical protein FACS1894122_06600 [Alphaproteobacteria bacterium]